MLSSKQRATNCGSFYLIKTIKNLTALITIDIAKRMR